MIIEDVEAFKTWLTAVLKPICEADPGALAKYVIALVKKDKSPEAMRESMVNQLEVFLQTETEQFVNQLFKTLETQDYITPVIPNANPPNPAAAAAIVAAPDEVVEIAVAAAPPKVMMKTVIPVAEIAASLSESLNGKVSAKEDAVVVSVKKEAPRRRERSRRRSLSRNRSRSRSWDRGGNSKRSKSREREAKSSSGHRGRQWRNKSPSSYRPYERRRSSNSPGGAAPRRSRSRSPRHTYRGRYRNRSPPASSRSRSRSRDRKDDPSAVVGGASPTNNVTSSSSSLQQPTPTDAVTGAAAAAVTSSGGGGGSAQQRSAAPKRRCRDYDEKGFCMQGELCPFDHGVDPVVLEDTALSRVLYAPNAPNVVTGGGGPGAPPGGGGGPDGGGGILGSGPPPGLMHGGVRPNIPAEYNPQAPQMWHHGRPPFRGGHRGGMNQGPPRMPMGPFPGGGGGPPPMMVPQRELISVPVMDAHHHQPHQQQDGGGFGGFSGPPARHHGYHHHHHSHQQNNGVNQMIMMDSGGGGGGGGGGLFKKKPFDFNRLGPRHKNPVNCSLELKKVPPGLNNITHLNNHFAKFGKIVNIQVFFEGDPEAAIITFSSHAEANAAYRSTEAVLNNRFIKVFWHSAAGMPPTAAPGAPTPNQTQPSIISDAAAINNNNNNNNNARQSLSVKERLGLNKLVNLHHHKSEKENNNNNQAGGANKTPEDTAVVVAAATKEDAKEVEIRAIKKNQELMAAKEKIKKNQEEKRKEALKLTADLRKRKQELLEKQLAQQKLLIEKMEKCPAGTQRDLLMQTIKKSQESIEAIRKDLSQTISVSKTQQQQQQLLVLQSQVKGNSNKETVQKELLDAELDLISKEAEGADTTELQKKLWELRVKAGGAGLLPNSALRLAQRGGSARNAASMRRFNPLMRLKLTKNNLIDNANNKAGKVHAVDHRPTKVLVSGYESDEKESVLQHFAQFGQITDHLADDATPSVVLNYKTRKEAEMAFSKGKHFQDRTLTITWSSQLTTLSSPGIMMKKTTTTMTASASALMQAEKEAICSLDDDSEVENNLIDGAGLGLGDEDCGPELSEEVLLQDDEEEEEENEEDRSWRR